MRILFLRVRETVWTLNYTSGDRTPPAPPKARWVGAVAAHPPRVLIYGSAPTECEPTDVSTRQGSRAAEHLLLLLEFDRLQRLVDALGRPRAGRRHCPRVVEAQPQLGRRLIVALVLRRRGRPPLDELQGALAQPQLEHEEPRDRAHVAVR
eukprot:5140997-Prymnesium_polylepis.1